MSPARLALAAAWVAIAAVLLLGCAPVTTPVSPPRVPTAELCLSDEELAPFLCNRITRAEGYECGLCAQKACVTTTFIYCAGDLGCDDPLCGPRRKRPQRAP